MIELTGFRQSDDSRCGVAVVKTILYYYGIDKNEDEVAKKCNHNYDYGCTNEDMVKALKSYGIGARIYKNSTIDDLEYWTRHRVPVIADIFMGNIESSATGHSVIVLGVDNRYVHVYDPFFGKNFSLEKIDFFRMWFDWDNTEFIEINTKMLLRLMIVPYPMKLDKMK